MFSLFAKGATQETDAKTSLLLKLLQRDNQQLRQELEDAHYRIRELEAASSPRVFVLPNHADDEDDVSVEVQSMDNGISVTSSTTTIPTGSALANEERAKQRQREEHRENASRSRRRKQRKAKTNSIASQFLDPYGELMRTQSETLTTLREDVPDDCSLPFLMDSSISSSSGISERSGEVSSDLSTRTQGSYYCKKNNDPKNQVATIAMRYMARIDSTDDSEISSTRTQGNGFCEI